MSKVLYLALSMRSIRLLLFIIGNIISFLFKKGDDVSKKKSMGYNIMAKGLYTTVGQKRKDCN